MIEARRAPAVTDRSLTHAYLLAKHRVIERGFEEEIAWQEAACLKSVTAKIFVREAAWVVLCGGMRESVVRARFGALGDAFALWEPEQIMRTPAVCERRALRVFNHPTKVRAIVRIASDVVRQGADAFVRGIETHGPTFLLQLPHIGPVTCFHLAKNLGCAVAKPDRHLERLACALGFAGARDLCSVIANALDEPIQVVDVVLWRYATLDPDYVTSLRRIALADRSTRDHGAPPPLLD